MSVTQFTSNEYVTRSNVNSRITQINNDITALNNKFPVSVSNGGTGQTSLTSGNILLGNGTSGVDSTAVLPVSKGGTGVTSLTSGNILLGNGTSGITSTAVLPVSKGGTGGATAIAARINLGVMTGVQLYYNASGTTGTISLSDNIKNYRIIDICFFVPVISSNWYATNRIYTQGAESFSTSLTINISSFRNPSTTNDPRVNAFAANLSISGTSLTRSSTLRAYVTNNMTPIVSATTDETTKICKIVGYNQ